VIYKWDITIKRYPVLNEKITVKTWPLSFKKFYAYRQYDIIDSKGEVIASADSVWFLIDTNRKRPTKVSNGMYEVYRLTDEDKEIADFGQLQGPKKVTTKKVFDVRYSDIDTNKHVNNAKYVDWCIETIPLEIMLKYSLKNIKVIYEKETKYGDTINAVCEVLEDGDSVICVHKIEDEEGKELTLARTEWCKK
jgi:medium-chain acyl-[acyl-carrier-protein] hydrolase